MRLLVFSAAFLAGCAPVYVAPTREFAEIEFDSVGTAMVTYLENGKECKGIKRFPPNTNFNASYPPLKVSGGSEIAFTMAASGAQQALGDGLYMGKNCFTAASFIPQATHKYRVRFIGSSSQCAIEVHRVIDTADGPTETSEPSARQRKFKRPFSQSGSFCEDI